MGFRWSGVQIPPARPTRAITSLWRLTRAAIDQSEIESAPFLRHASDRVGREIDATGNVLQDHLQRRVLAFEAVTEHCVGGGVSAHGHRVGLSLGDVMRSDAGSQAIGPVDVRAGVGAIRGDVRYAVFRYRVPVVVLQRAD